MGLLIRDLSRWVRHDMQDPSYYYDQTVLIGWLAAVCVSLPLLIAWHSRRFVGLTWRLFVSGQLRPVLSSRACSSVG